MACACTLMQHSQPTRAPKAGLGKLSKNRPKDDCMYAPAPAPSAVLRNSGLLQEASKHSFEIGPRRAHKKPKNGAASFAQPFKFHIVLCNSRLPFLKTSISHTRQNRVVLTERAKEWCCKLCTAFLSHSLTRMSPAFSQDPSHSHLRQNGGLPVPMPMKLAKERLQALHQHQQRGHRSRPKILMISPAFHVHQLLPQPFVPALPTNCTPYS